MLQVLALLAGWGALSVLLAACWGVVARALRAPTSAAAARPAPPTFDRTVDRALGCRTVPLVVRR